MKKILLTPLLVVFLSVVAYAKSGLFIGADVGVYSNNKDFIQSSVGEVKQNKNLNPTFGLKLGYQQYFGFIGLRAYGSANYISIAKETTITQNGAFDKLGSNGTTKYNGYNLGANVDLLLKFDILDAFGIGAFAGVGYEYVKFNDANVNIQSQDLGGTDISGKISNINGNGIVYNLGLQAIIFGSHQIELGFKISPYVIESTNNLKNGDVQNESITSSKTKLEGAITIGYRYIF